MIISFLDNNNKLQTVIKDNVEISHNHNEPSKSFLHCRGQYICSIIDLKTIKEQFSEDIIHKHLH